MTSQNDPSTQNAKFKTTDYYLPFFRLAGEILYAIMKCLSNLSQKAATQTCHMQLATANLSNTTCEHKLPTQNAQTHNFQLKTCKHTTSNTTLKHKIAKHKLKQRHADTFGRQLLPAVRPRGPGQIQRKARAKAIGQLQVRDSVRRVLAKAPGAKSPRNPC